MLPRRFEAKLDELEETHLPTGMHFRITRDYGETANEKVNELIEGLVVAVLTVVGIDRFDDGMASGTGDRAGDSGLLQPDAVHQPDGRLFDQSRHDVRVDSGARACWSTIRSPMSRTLLATSR